MVGPIIMKKINYWLLPSREQSGGEERRGGGGVVAATGTSPRRSPSAVSCNVFFVSFSF